MTTTTEVASSPNNSLPIVLACGGGTPLARLSYDLAVTLEKDGIAEMACLMSYQTKQDTSPLEERELIVIDGCGSQCVKAWLANKAMKPKYYFDLSDSVFGLDLESKQECTLKDLFNVLNIIHREVKS